MSFKVEPPGRARGKDNLPRLFLDCDQVLANFDAHAEQVFGMAPEEAQAKLGSKSFWEILRAQGDFFLMLQVLPEGKRLFEAVRHLNPTILTGTPPEVPEAAAQKRVWAARHFPGTEIICCKSEEKRMYMKPGDVLVDDWSKYRHLWEEAGGVFILNRDVDDSIRQVLNLFAWQKNRASMPWLLAAASLPL